MHEIETTWTNQATISYRIRNLLRTLSFPQGNVEMRVAAAGGRRLPSGLCHESARLSLAFLVNFYDSPISSSSSSVFPSFSGKGRIASASVHVVPEMVHPARAQTCGLGSPFAKMSSEMRDLPKCTGLCEKIPASLNYPAIFLPTDLGSQCTAHQP